MDFRVFSAGLKPIAFFDLPETEYPLTEKPRLFQDPAGLAVLRRIAAGLSRAGYPITEPKQAIGIEAGFRCEALPKFKISILLGVYRKHWAVRCFLESRYHPPFLQRRRDQPLPPDRVEAWGHLLTVIDQQIRDNLRASSVIWLTHADARSQHKREEDEEI